MSAAYPQLTIEYETDYHYPDGPAPDSGSVIIHYYGKKKGRKIS